MGCLMLHMCRYYMSGDEPAAGSETVIVDEGAGISKVEQDSIAQSMLAQVAQMLGSLVGGQHKHHHNQQASFPSYEPPGGWVPPGVYEVCGRTHTG